MIKRKTYRNFLIIRNKLMNEKHYDPRTAEKITHQIFDELAYYPDRSAEWFYNMILSKEDFESTYGAKETAI